METPFHSIASLFDQLGLDSTEEGIDAFIARNSPLPENVKRYFDNHEPAKGKKAQIRATIIWKERELKGITHLHVPYMYRNC